MNKIELAEELFYDHNWKPGALFEALLVRGWNLYDLTRFARKMLRLAEECQDPFVQEFFILFTNNIVVNAHMLPKKSGGKFL